MGLPHLPFDLVILDLDGTILNENHESGFSPAVYQTIAAVQAAGIPVTIASGRPLSHVRQRAAQLQITHPVVTAQGAVVGHPVSGHILTEHPMPLAAAREVARWADTSGRVVFFYFVDEDGETHIYQNREVWERSSYDHLFGGGRVLQPNLQALVEADHVHPPIKFIVINDVSTEPDMVPELRSRFGHWLQITRSHAILVEGTERDVDKGQGVLHMLALVGIDPARVMAIGDNYNDIPMLQAVGFGVAMGQAEAAVQAAARWIAPSIDEDGAAVALQRFILDRLPGSQ